MARRPRQVVAGGVYHVVARGNGGSTIFRADDDRAEYLKLLGQVVGRFGWHFLAYCLMGTHVHLLVETPEPNLPAGMQWLHGRYGRYFNDRHGLYGHVFQGRYKAIRQETDEQLWHLLRYVALNPVKAGLCRRPQDYRWSSCAATLARNEGPLARDGDLVAVDRLSWFLGAPDRERGREMYGQLVARSSSERARQDSNLGPSVP